MTRATFTPYQCRLFFFLSVASFFEGYDFFAFSQVLPNLSESMDLSKTAQGIMYSAISAGAVGAYALVRLADRWGRRKVLTITIVGYTVFTFATGFAQGPITFTIAQFLARLFLVGEWAVAMIYAAEEFPADRRGMVIGVIQASVGFGAIVCAGTVPRLIETSLQWRAVYLVAVLPLGLVIYARRGLQETQRFQSLGPNRKVRERSIFYVFRTPYRNRIVQLGLIWATVALCVNVAIVFWKQFATGERGFTDAQAGHSVVIAALVAMPLIFGVGKLIDKIGRRAGATMIFTLTAAGVVAAYTLHDRVLLTVALGFSIFGVSAIPVVLNSLTTELFPTDIRGDAFGWCNNLLGRSGYFLAPMAVGWAADWFGELGLVVAVTAVFPMVSVVLVLLFLPETKGRELEQTAMI